MYVQLKRAQLASGRFKLIAVEVWLQCKPLQVKFQQFGDFVHIEGK